MYEIYIIIWPTHFSTFTYHVPIPPQQQQTLNGKFHASLELTWSTAFIVIVTMCLFCVHQVACVGWTWSTVTTRCVRQWSTRNRPSTNVVAPTREGRASRKATSTKATSSAWTTSKPTTSAKLAWVRPSPSQLRRKITNKYSISFFFFCRNVFRNSMRERKGLWRHFRSSALCVSVSQVRQQPAHATSVRNERRHVRQPVPLHGGELSREGDASDWLHGPMQTWATIQALYSLHHSPILHHIF